MNSSEAGPQAHSVSASAMDPDGYGHPECPRIEHLVAQVKMAVAAARQGLHADVASSQSMSFRVQYDIRGVELHALPEGDQINHLAFFKSCFEDFGLEFSALGDLGMLVHGSKHSNVLIH